MKTTKQTVLSVLGNAQHHETWIADPKGCRAHFSVEDLIKMRRACVLMAQNPFIKAIEIPPPSADLLWEDEDEVTERLWLDCVHCRQSNFIITWQHKDNAAFVVESESFPYSTVDIPTPEKIRSMS